MNMSMSCCDGTIDIGAEWVSPVAMMSGIIGGGHGDTSLVTSSITLGGTGGGGEECNGCSGAGCSEIESSVGAESTVSAAGKEAADLVPYLLVEERGRGLSFMVARI
jgi:hypothetical protein